MAAANVNLVRGKVAADNNCLFTACAFLCQGANSDGELRSAAKKLRSMCADTVLADPEPETRALMLGHDSVDAYVSWIKQDTHWGGETEIVMLAEHFGVEIVVCSCESLRNMHYNSGDDGRKRVHLLYTGQHYDPLLGPEPESTRCFPADDSAKSEREAAALALANQHNADAAKRAKERRVNRLKCGGCGALLADAAAFQEHCGLVEHDDDFTYECEQVEVVIAEGEDLPEGSVDLNSPDIHTFYNASAPDVLSLAMRCGLAPFEYDGLPYESMEMFWASERVNVAPALERESMLGKGLRAQYATEAAAGLRSHLLATGDKMIVNVDSNPWLGMQASGGVSTGQNKLGKEYMALREELRAAAAAE